MRTSESQGLDKNFFYYKTAPEVFSEINLCIDLFTSDPGKAIMLDLNLNSTFSWFTRNYCNQPVGLS